METISYPRGTKLGRPPAIALLPEDAAIVRDAVKATTRYYGIRQQDLGNWVVAAMRKSAAMSVETAERLFRLVQQPDASLVKRKPALGMSLQELQAAIERHWEEPENNPRPQGPTMDYVLKIFEAAKIVNNYARPQPGSTFFVIPGTSQRISELLVESFVDELSNETFSEQLQRKLVDHLSFYFKVAERPLREVENKALLDRLYTLGMLNRFDLADEVGKSFPEEELYDPIPRTVMEALIAAEAERTAKPNPKPSPAKSKRERRTRRR